MMPEYVTTDARLPTCQHCNRRMVVGEVESFNSAADLDVIVYKCQSCDLAGEIVRTQEMIQGAKEFIKDNMRDADIITITAVRLRALYAHLEKLKKTVPRSITEVRSSRGDARAV